MINQSIRVIASDEHFITEKGFVVKDNSTIVLVHD